MPIVNFLLPLHPHFHLISLSSSLPHDVRRPLLHSILWPKNSLWLVHLQVVCVRLYCIIDFSQCGWLQIFNQHVLCYTHTNCLCFYMLQAIHRHQLSKHWLKRLLDARVHISQCNSACFIVVPTFSEQEKELGVSTYLTTSDLEHHAESTSSSLLYLTLQTLGLTLYYLVGTSPNLYSHLGVSHVLWESPVYSSLRKIFCLDSELWEE